MKTHTFIVMLSFILILTEFRTLFAGSTKDHFKTVHFQSGKLTLGGELYLPNGSGPFPAILYNHGSAPKMLNSMASEVIGPMFTKKGWVFFMPYRRGQGLSEEAGPYVMDEINEAKRGGFGEAVKRMITLLKTDHLDDQMAALEWLKKQKFVQKDRIATMGNSFGGIEVVLGMASYSYCAGVNASGGARSWQSSGELQVLMKKSVAAAKGPIFFFQAENDYDLSPSRTLSSEMKKAKKIVKIKIYPAFGNSPKQGHSFPYKGASIWFDDVYKFVSNYCQ